MSNANEGFDITPENLEAYLKQTQGGDAKLVGVGEIGSLDDQGFKEFGYGKPLKITYEQGGQTKEAVLSVMRGDQYGHQFYWDRAAILLCQYETGKLMERHVQPLGLGYLDASQRLNPVNEPREFFILNEKIEGHDYFTDLDRIKQGEVEPRDMALVKNLAKWLAELHSKKLDAPDLYQRRTRQTVGDSECVFGLVDDYPHPYEHFPPERFISLEKKLIEWRWKLNKYTHRLSAVHGDFHPFNLLVNGDDFRVLDRSRGEWGEPADDVTCMSLNFVLWGIYDQPRLQGPLEKMYMTFWEEYLGETNDHELLEVAAPYFVFRCLVIASPKWYNHPLEVRQGFFRFMENVLDDGTFKYADINSYMK